MATTAPLGKWGARRNKPAWKWGVTAWTRVCPQAVARPLHSGTPHTWHGRTPTPCEARGAAVDALPLCSLFTAEGRKWKQGGHFQAGSPQESRLAGPSGAQTGCHGPNTRTPLGAQPHGCVHHTAALAPRPCRPLGAHVSFCAKESSPQPLLHLLPHSLNRPLSLWCGAFFYWDIIRVYNSVGLRTFVGLGSIATI